MRYLLGIMLALLVAAPSWAVDLYGVSPITRTGHVAYRVDLDATRHPAGIYTVGKAFAMALLDFEFGASHSSVLYACDEPGGAQGVAVGADSDGDGDLSDEAGCVSKATLATADVTVDPLKAKKLWYVLDVNTAGTGTLTIKGTWDQVASGGGSGGVPSGWPTLENLGGTGRTTQALVVDVLNLHQWTNGPGRDDNGSIFTGTADAVTDTTYIGGAVGTTAGSTMGIGATAAQFSNLLTVDAADDEWRWMCRDSTSFAHEIGTAGDTELADYGDSIPLVIHDDSEDTYRVIGVDTATGTFACTTGSGTISMRNNVLFDLTTSDTVQPFFVDTVHVTAYGGRWWAQRLLLSAWMDQYPETLGLTNLISSGYGESGCGAWTLSAGSGGTATPNNTGHDPGTDSLLGNGCRWTRTSAAGTATTATVNATPGEYYVGQVMINGGSVSASRVLILRVEDNAGNNNTTAKFWVEGQPNGGYIQAADVIDSSGTGTAGEYQIPERTCYGGCTLRFAFKVEAGDTGFQIQIEDTDVATTNMVIDEAWVRKKVYQDTERHYLIPDGPAEIKVFTDSRGSVASIERFTGALDYMLGFESPLGDQRTTIRPNLYVSKKPSSIQYSVSGSTLGEIVGANDDYLDYDGSAIGTRLENLIADSTNYCVSLFGVNDQLGAGNAREGTAAGASPADTGNEHLYFVDQLRGFEMAAEKEGCIPIIMMDHMTRVDTSNTDCHDENAGAINCGTWHEDSWVEALHNGLTDS